MGSACGKTIWEKLQNQYFFGGWGGGGQATGEHWGPPKHRGNMGAQANFSDSRGNSSNPPTRGNPELYRGDFL